MTEKLSAKPILFRPCELSDIFQETKPGEYYLKFGACFQICSEEGNTIYGDGSPAIQYEKYSANKLKCVGKASEPVGYDGRFFAVRFSKGIKLEYLSQSLRTMIEQSHPSHPLLPALKEYMAETDHTPGWDMEYIMNSYEHKTKPLILILCKDEIIDGKIMRYMPRPIQIAQGIYRSF